MQGRRLVMHEPFHVELEDFEIDPDALGEGELLVRHHVSAISPGTELASFTGLAMESDTTNYGKYPFRPGYAAVGEVIAVGPGSARVPIGTNILHNGGHATLAVSRAGGLVMPVSSDVPDEDAVYARLAAISITAQRLSSVQPGETVAVVGLGMIGNFAAQIFHMAGVRVLGVDPNARRRDIAAACGIQERLQSIDEILEATNGAGAETVVDATGMPDPVAASIDVVARFGELILLGTPRGQPRSPINFTHFVSRAHEKSIRIIGAHASTSPQRDGTGPPRVPVRLSTEANVRYLLDQMRTTTTGRKLHVAPLRTHMLAPEQAQEGYAGLHERPDQFMGVVFGWTHV